MHQLDRSRSRASSARRLADRPLLDRVRGQCQASAQPSRGHPLPGRQNPRLGARAGAHEQQAAARHPSRRRALVSMTAGPGLPAHTGSMGRMIWAILGAILPIWVGFMAIGWIFAMLKTFFVIGLIAVVVFIIVSLVAKLPRRG